MYNTVYHVHSSYYKCRFSILILQRNNLSLMSFVKGGMYIFQLLDWYSVSIPVLVICIFEIIMVAWIYGIDNFFDDINFMIGQKLEKIWYYCWKYITPLILVVSYAFWYFIGINITYSLLFFAVNFLYHCCVP